MRIRQVKPAFWTDGKIGHLPAHTRLFYIGTWMLADDAGWFDWQTAEIGASLYPFDPVTTRERRVNEMGESLVSVGCLIVYQCGHAQVPHLVDHQRLAGPTRRVDTTHRRHLNECSPAVPRGFPRIPARLGQVRSVEVSSPADDAAGLKEVVQIDPTTGTYLYVSPEAKA